MKYNIMKTIKVDFRKFPDTPIVTSNFKLTDNQLLALESLSPDVEILNLDVETSGQHILIKNASCQYYNTQEHKMSNIIPMIKTEIDDMLYHSSDSNIHEFLTNDMSK